MARKRNNNNRRSNFRHGNGDGQMNREDPAKTYAWALLRGDNETLKSMTIISDEGTIGAMSSYKQSLEKIGAMLPTFVHRHGPIIEVDLEGAQGQVVGCVRLVRAGGKFASGAQIFQRVA